MSSYLASNTSHHGGLWHRGTWSQRKNQCKITWDREVIFLPDKYACLELSCCKEDASAGNRLRWKPDKQVGPQTVVHVVPTRRCTYLSYDSSTLATGGGSRALVALVRRADLSHFSFYNKSVSPSSLSKSGCSFCLYINVQNLKVGDNHLQRERGRRSHVAVHLRVVWDC